MLHFNELYISEDGQNLVTDVEIDDFEVYEKATLKSINLKLNYCSDNQSTISLWENTPIVVGDFDDDGSVTEADALFLEYLVEVIATDIYRTQDGTYFYFNRGSMLRSNGLPPALIEYFESLDERDRPANPNQYEYGVMLTKDFVDFVVSVRNNYPSAFGATNNTPALTGSSNDSTESVDQLVVISDEGYQTFNDDYTLAYEFSRDMDNGKGSALSYIMERFGDGLKLMTNSSVPGDFGNDGEVNVNDINILIDRLSDIVDGVSQEIVYYEPVKHKHVCISANDLRLPPGFTDFSSDLFIVEAEAVFTGDYSELSAMGCSWDISNITGVAYNGKPFYDAAVGYSNAYGDTCDTNDASAFEDFILRYYAFLFAVKCGDICQAKYYWDTYLKGSSAQLGVGPNKTCGCHGTRR